MIKQLSILLILCILIFSSCAATDVVLNYSRDSLNDIVNEYPEIIQSNVDGFILSADGLTHLYIHADSSPDIVDFVLRTPIEPFLSAGLDVSLLNENFLFDDEYLYMVTNFGHHSSKSSDVVEAVFNAVDANRDILSYHNELDHFVIKLSAGKFEFAKDHRVNDKDLVFIINANFIADAGVDINNIEGWMFAEMDEMQLLLKAYDLN